MIFKSCDVLLIFVLGFHNIPLQKCHSQRESENLGWIDIQSIKIQHLNYTSQQVLHQRKFSLLTKKCKSSTVSKRLELDETGYLKNKLRSVSESHTWNNVRAACKHTT